MILPLDTTSLKPEFPPVLPMAAEALLVEYLSSSLSDVVVDVSSAALGNLNFSDGFGSDGNAW